jgi:hypothetical protein
MRVYRKSSRAASKFHDGALLLDKPTARCAVISARRLDWQVAPANMTTNCKRCLAIRKGGR